MVGFSYSPAMDISEIIASYLQKADKLLEKAAKETNIEKGLALRSMAETYVSMAGVLSKTSYPPRVTTEDKDEPKESAKDEGERVAAAYDILDPVLDFLIEIARGRRR